MNTEVKKWDDELVVSYTYLTVQPWQVPLLGEVIEDILVLSAEFKEVLD